MSARKHVGLEHTNWSWRYAHVLRLTNCWRS